MMRQQTIRAVTWRLALFAGVMAGLLALVATAITRPVSGANAEFRAEFTDASGLKTGDDVRMFGVQVGKVTAIELREGIAQVTLRTRPERPIYTASVLAIRYQSLTGQRYVDVRQPDTAGEPLPTGSVIGVDATIPSFDITQLFNGLQPVLAEFSPGALNQFTESVLAVIEGDGSGIGPALDALEQLSAYVSDRQLVLSTIVANMREISDQIDGRSPHLITLLRGLADVFTSFREKLAGLLDFAEVAPSALAPLNSLMKTLGFTEDSNPDLDHALRQLFPDPEAALDLLGSLPGLVQALANLLPPTGAVAATIDRTCSNGPAEVPGAAAILIAGQGISICQN